jgi:large subunit ribosomal protein L9
VLAENLKQRAFKEQKLVDDANALAKKISGLDVKIAAKAGGTGKLFGSIGNADLSAALQTAGHDIEKKFIKITGGTVKVLGKHQAEIRLHREVKVQLDFEVTKAVDKE